MMARSPRFARSFAWLMVVPLMPLVVLAGCRSSSSSQNNSGGGCCGGGGGCCRGATPSNPLAGADRSTSTAIDRSPSALTTRGDSATMNPSSPSAQGLYGGQKTCPVTGEPLGSMGPAVPVTVKGQTIYVCCRGCVAKVQRDPDVFLRKVEAERWPRSQSAF